MRLSGTESQAVRARKPCPVHERCTERQLPFPLLRKEVRASTACDRRFPRRSAAAESRWPCGILTRLQIRLAEVLAADAHPESSFLTRPQTKRCRLCAKSAKTILFAGSCVSPLHFFHRQKLLPETCLPATEVLGRRKFATPGCSGICVIGHRSPACSPPGKHSAKQVCVAKASLLPRDGDAG